MPTTLAAVDAYIAKSAPFAQPILTKVRAAAHKAVPDIDEAIKWSMPFFMYRGVILGNMAAFKHHCSLGFWGSEMKAQLVEDGLDSEDGMGSIGKLASVKDLPGDKVLAGYFRQAAALIADGTRTQSIVRPKPAAKAKAKPELPPDLTAALKKSKTAKATFDAFPPSCQREYVEWITEAKREETRTKRVEQAVAWMAEGKRRHWKYENC